MSFEPRSPIGETLYAHREEVLEIARRWHASNVRVFGSVVRGEDDAHSDVDLLVDFAPGSRAFDVLGLAGDLDQALGVRVDVGTEEDLRPSARQVILSGAVSL